MRRAMTARVSGERAFAIVLAAMFVAMVVAARDYPWEPRLFPTVVALAGVALAVAAAARARSIEPPREREPRRRIVLALVAPPLYGGALFLLGFWIATLVAIPVLARALGFRKVPVLIAVTAVVTAAVGLGFGAVDVRLPHGALVRAATGGAGR